MFTLSRQSGFILSLGGLSLSGLILIFGNADAQQAPAPAARTPT